MMITAEARADDPDPNYSDGSYGRLEGDLLFVGEVGAALASGGPQFETHLSLLYLSTAGGYFRYVESFERFMVANYAGRFDGWSGQSFETLGQEPAPRDTAVVKSRLIDPEGEDVVLNYRMHLIDGKWKVIDVFLDGTVSELALRRSEFVSIVQRDGIDGLVKTLDAKIAKLAAGGES